MEYSIVSREEKQIPRMIRDQIPGDERMLILHSDGVVEKTIIGKPAELMDVVRGVGAGISTAPKDLDFGTRKPAEINTNKNNEEGEGTEEVSNKQNSNNILGLLFGGNFIGLDNISLEGFLNKVKGSGKRLLAVNKSSAVAGYRREVGKVALENIMKRFVIPWLEKVTPGINVPFFGKKSPINLEKHSEIISLVVGNLAFFGVDVFSYFGIPMTSKLEFATNCMMEYSYQKAMDKLAAITPKMTGINKVTDFFDVLDLPPGHERLMTEDEKKVSNVTTDKDKLAEGIANLPPQA